MGKPLHNEILVLIYIFSLPLVHFMLASGWVSWSSS